MTAELLFDDQTQRITASKDYVAGAQSRVLGQNDKTTFKVLSRSVLTDAALTPVAGDFYVIPPIGTPAGGFAPFVANEIVAWDAELSVWTKVGPEIGDIVDILDEDEARRWSGSAYEFVYAAPRPTAVLPDGGGVMEVAPGGVYSGPADGGAITGLVGLAEGESCTFRRGSVDYSFVHQADVSANPFAVNFFLSGEQDFVVAATNANQLTVTNTGGALEMSGGGSGASSSLEDPSNHATIAQLTDISSAINTSNKALGKQVLILPEMRTYFALGAAAGDAWRPVDDQSGLSDIAPA
ncbi:MAG: hypothetical protein AAGB02_03185 [Pseudomonadota bacterium]